MKLIYIFSLGLGVTLTLISCERDLLGTPLNFEFMQIEHTVSGTWINPSALRIDGDGRAVLTQRYQANADSADSLSAILASGKRRYLAGLFPGFDKLKSYYAPVRPVMDAEYQKIVLNYHGTSDTVAVYDAAHAHLPLSLKIILEELTKIRADLQKTLRH